MEKKPLTPTQMLVKIGVEWFLLVALVFIVLGVFG